MDDQQQSGPSIRRIGGAARRPVVMSQEQLVKMGPLEGGGSLPWVIEPATAGIDLAAWAQAHRDQITALLEQHGGLLFRGFSPRTVEEFQVAVHAISGELLEYRERSSPRHSVGERVYTSTDYPPSEPIFLHNENSYQKAWPMRIFFFCEREPATGGETPIADSRRVYARIPAEIRERFEGRGWMYVRNFGDGLGLPWQTVFGTEDREVVESHCAASGIEVEWKADNRLRARAVRPAISKHPKTGELTWFNHATFFHISTLSPRVREALLEELGPDDLPTNTFYGDGSPIEPEVLDELRAAYAAETVRFRWQRGDLLLLDNMMVAHAREPYTGERKILVAMAEPMSWERLSR